MNSKQKFSSFQLFATYGIIKLSDISRSELFTQDSETHFILDYVEEFPDGLAFDLLVDGGKIDVDLFFSEEIFQDSESILSIIVPFNVGIDGSIEFSDYGSQEEIDIPPGNYGVLYETGFKPENVHWLLYDGKPGIHTIDTWCKFTFVPNLSVEPAVLVSSGYPTLNPPSELFDQS